MRRRSMSDDATLAPWVSGPFCIARTGDASSRFEVSAEALMSSSPIWRTSAAFCEKAGLCTSSATMLSTYAATFSSSAGSAAASIGTMPAAFCGATAATGAGAVSVSSALGEVRVSGSALITCSFAVLANTAGILRDPRGRACEPRPSTRCPGHQGGR